MYVVYLDRLHQSMDHNMEVMKTNTELQSLFKELNINEKKPERLFVLWNQQFINSTTSGERSNHIYNN